METDAATFIIFRTTAITDRHWSTSTETPLEEESISDVELARERNLRSLHEALSSWVEPHEHAKITVHETLTRVTRGRKEVRTLEPYPILYRSMNPER